MCLSFFYFSKPGRLLFFFTLFINSVQAQTRVAGFLVYENIPGLGNGNLSAISQSSDGFLWIGSENGLIRFDGYRYQVIKASENSIANNHITDVAIDSNGLVWIAGLTGGVSCHNPATRKFKQYKKLWSSLEDAQTVNRILVQPNGKVWLATAGNGLGCFNKQTDAFDFYKPHQVSSASSNNNIIDIVNDRQNPDIILLITRHQLFSFNTQNGTFTRLPAAPVKGAEYSCIEYDNNNKGVWIGSYSGGIQYYNLLTARLSQHPIVINGTEAKTVRSADVAAVSDSTLWWACEEFGLLEYNTRTKQYLFAGPAFRYDSTQKSNYSFLRISKSNSAGVFVGMGGAYLQCHPSYKRLNRLVPQGKTIQKTQVSAVSVDGKGQYFVATTDNVALQILSPSLKIIRTISLPVKGKIATFFKSQNNTITAVTAGGKLYTAPPFGNMLVPTGYISLKGEVKKMKPGRDNNWWIHTSSNIYKWKEGANSPSDSFLFNNIIYAVDADITGNLWAITNKGLYKTDELTKKLIVQKLPSNNLTTEKGSLQNIIIDSLDNIWLTGDGEYLYCYNIGKNKLTTPLKGKGFPNTAIHALALLPGDKLLMATTDGLCQLDIKTLGWNFVDKLDGLFQNNINSGLLTTEDGLIVVNNYYQYNIFHARELSALPQTLNLNVVSLSINDVAQPELLLSTDPLTIVLPYKKIQYR